MMLSYHQPTTPGKPCTNALIKSKVKKVIYSIEDADTRSFNKSKKILNVVENIHVISEAKKIKNNLTKVKKIKNKAIIKSKEKLKKTKSKKNIRTLWVRRKKKNQINPLLGELALAKKFNKRYKETKAIPMSKK